MSLILDALKRAERERRGDAGPALRDMPPPVIAGMALPPRARRAVPFAVIAAAALALCAFLLWDAFRPAPPPAPAAEAPFAPKPVEPQAAIQARPAPPETAVVPGTEDVASLDDLTDESALDDPAVPEPLEILTSAPEVADDIKALRARITVGLTERNAQFEKLRAEALAIQEQFKKLGLVPSKKNC
jgi:hypothetical protein